MNVEEKLKKYLLGQEIDRIEQGEVLYLKNGVALELYESDQDCCAGARGTWTLPDGEIHGGITEVKFEEETYCEEYGDRSSECVITLLHENQAVASAEGYAGAGNGGYYFSVLSLRVKVDDKTIDVFDVISV